MGEKEARHGLRNDSGVPVRTLLAPLDTETAEPARTEGLSQVQEHLLEPAPDAPG